MLNHCKSNRLTFLDIIRRLRNDEIEHTEVADCGMAKDLKMIIADEIEHA